AIGGAHGISVGDLDVELVDGFRRDRPIERDAGLERALRPGRDGLGRLAIDVADPEELPFALRAASPIGAARMRRHDEIAARRQARIHRQEPEAREERGTRRVPCRIAVTPMELGAIDDAARVPGDEDVPCEVRGPEGWSSFLRLVEDESTRRLVLRAVVEDRRLVDDVGEMLRVARRKPIVTRGQDMEKLVARVASGKPGLAFLVGREEIAMTIEREADRETNARA